MMAEQHPFRKYRIIIYLLFVTLVIFGSVSLMYLDFNLLPDIQYPELVVMTFYPNASTQEISNLVTRPIEETAGALKGVKNVNSISREGVSIVKIQYDWGVSLTVAHIELREKVDLIVPMFPKEVQRPMIINYQSSLDALIGILVIPDTEGGEKKDPRDLYLLCKKDVKAFLEKTGGVSNAKLLGGERPEVDFTVDPEDLVKYSFGIDEIRNVIDSSNKNYPIGFLDDGSLEYQLRVNGEIKDYKDLGSIVLKNEKSRLVYCSDLGSITYTTEEKRSDITIDGTSAIMFQIFKQPSFNVIKLSANIDKALAILNDRYKGRLVFEKAFDESQYMSETLRDLILSMIVGIICTIISIYVFIFDLRLCGAITLTLPISIIATFIVMRMSNMSMNLLTLGGFSLAIGMIVDNAVIVVTNILNQLGLPEKGSMYYKKVNEVIPAVISSTLTTVVVFFPVIFLSGILKLIFLQLSVIIVVSLVFSMFAAILLIPAMAQSITVKPKVLEAMENNRFALSLEILYEKGLKLVFRKRTAALVILTLTIIAGVLSYPVMQKSFIDSTPSNYFYLKMFIKDQVSFSYTENMVRQITKLISGVGGITKIIATLGVDKDDLTFNIDGIYGENTAILKIYTKKSGSSLYSVIDKVRHKCSVIDGVDFIMAIPDNPIQRMLSRSEFQRSLKIFDLPADQLVSQTNEITHFLAREKSVADVFSPYYIIAEENQFLIKRDQLAMYNINPLSVGQLLATAVSGMRIGQWKKDEYEIPILLKFTANRYDSVDKLLTLSVKNNEGKLIKLGEVISENDTKMPPYIFRENQRYYSEIDFNSLKKKGSIFANRDAYVGELKKTLRGKKIEFTYSDQFTLLKDNYGELFLAVLLSLFLEYAILAAQFRSFSKPVLAIAMIPICIPGILFIELLIGLSLNLNTFMGIIALCGLLVNNTIMLFFEYDQGSVNTPEDVIKASVARLRPIFITHLATTLALVPILFTGNKIQITLAVNLILGLVYATGVTLIYLPMFYYNLFIARRGKTKVHHVQGTAE